MPPVEEHFSPLLSVKGAAAHLGMSKDWVYENLKRLIPHGKIGGALRFRKEDVDRYIASGTVAPLNPRTSDLPSRFGRSCVSRVYRIATPRGKTRWYVCVTYRGQRYREVGGDTKQAALKRLRELEARLEKVGDLTPKRVPFSFLCDEYLRWATVNLAPRTRKEREYITRVHLNKFFNGLVSDIDAHSIETYKASRLQIPIAPITLNTHLKVLSCILKYGQENKLLAELPKIRRVRVPKKTPKFLSADEIGRVLAAARADVRPMLQLMIFTGLRKGELRHLEWSDVDLKNRLLHVRPKETWSPKTDNSARTIPLCEPAVEALWMALERAKNKKVISTLVFPGRKGGPLTDIRDSLNGACKRAGVPRIHVHGLRHTFGSQMAMAGADPFAIMKAMGHADIKTTMIYVSLGKSHIRDQVERLNEIKVPPFSPAKGKSRDIDRNRRAMLRVVRNP